MIWRAKLQQIVRHWLREPLVHFLVAGLAVFAFAALRGEPVDPASRKITIGEEQVNRLVSQWQSAWRRTPTPDEIDALIRDHIKEEIYYREARRLGLDEDDPIVRRHLRTKMEDLGIAAAEQAVPTDETLQAWIDRYPARYATNPRYSFDQIYLGQISGKALADRAADVQRLLRAGTDWTVVGERISLPRSLDQHDRIAIARQFGDGFAPSLAEQPPGSWRGPVASGFGQHLVRVRAVTAPATPLLGDVRQAAENDWRATTQAARRARAYQLLLDSYTIKIERP
jgi:peptidyl-prolyl cis-trans isomerase C